MKSQTISTMGNVGPKTRLLGQMLEKPFVSSRGHNFCQIIMKFFQIVYLDKISDTSENGPCRVKNNVTRQNLRKTLCTLWSQNFSFIIMKVGQNVSLD